VKLRDHNANLGRLTSSDVSVEKLAFCPKQAKLWGMEKYPDDDENRLWRILARFYFRGFRRREVFRQPAAPDFVNHRAVCRNLVARASRARIIPYKQVEFTNEERAKRPLATHTVSLGINRIAIYSPGIQRLYCRPINVIMSPTGKNSSIARQSIMRRAIGPLVCLQPTTRMPDRAIITSPTEKPGTEKIKADGIRSS
jgi:hypothetical protein